MEQKKQVKQFIIFGFLFLFVFVLGIIPPIDAHPHSTIDLMESHSHDASNEKFQEHFLIHTFEQVIFSLVDFVNGIFSK